MSHFYLVTFQNHLALYQLLLSSSDQCMATEREVESTDWYCTSHSYGLQDGISAVQFWRM